MEMRQHCIYSRLMAISQFVILLILGIAFFLWRFSLDAMSAFPFLSLLASSSIPR